LILPEVFIINEGEIGNELYFLFRGKVRVYIHGNYINLIKDGEVFGEIGKKLQL
jgi:CRP-like cAMP-binding protein